MKSSIHARGLLAVTIGAVLAGSAQAQQSPAPASVLDEVVVTAQKRSEKIQDVPVAVTVVSADQLAQQRVYSIADLARTTPSLEMIQAFGGPGGGGQIRGVGTQSFTRSAEGAVGIVVDGVPQGNLPNNAIFDLAQVEVLRGPQGTLFGLTSSAGVINMRTVAPDTTAVSGYAHVDYSDQGKAGSVFGQQTIKAALNLPLSATSALRLSANANRVDGVEKNAYNGENDVLKDGALRARYLWRASDDITVNLIADYDKRQQNYGDPEFVYVNVPAGTPLATQLAACGIVASYSNNEFCSKLPANTDLKNYGFSAQVDWALGGGTLTSITGWRKNEQLPSSTDIMSNPQEFTQIFIKGSTNSGRQFSQELRYASPTGKAVDYVAGVFFSDYQANTGYVPNGGFFVGSYQIAPVFVPFDQDGTSTDTTSRSYAGFGQATFHVDDKLAFLAGLRYTHQRLTDATSANPYVGSSVPTAGETSKSNVSGKVGAQYKFAPDLTAYATVTKGYKGPQVEPAAQGTPTVVVAPELPLAYELGLKGSTASGRLGYDVTLFYTDIKDYQGQRCYINPVGVLTCSGDSIPSVTTKGVELNLFGRPLEGLTLNAGFIYNIAQFPNGWTGYNPNDLRPPVPGTTNGTTDLSGDQIVGVPKQKFTFSGEYVHPVGAVDGFVGADTVYKSEERLAYSGDPRFLYPAHWTTGARIGLRAHDHRWSVEAFGRNLGNQHEPATLFGGPSYLPPGTVPFIPNGQVNGISGWTLPTSLRQVGLSAEVRW